MDVHYHCMTNYWNLSSRFRESTYMPWQDQHNTHNAGSILAVGSESRTSITKTNSLGFDCMSSHMDTQTDGVADIQVKM